MIMCLIPRRILFGDRSSWGDEMCVGLLGGGVGGRFAFEMGMGQRGFCSDIFDAIWVFISANTT